MQFIKKTSLRTNILGLTVKLALALVIILGIVFLLNKIDFPAPIIPIKTRFLFKFISFFIEKTQICLILKLIKVICNFIKKQEVENILF